MEEPQVRVAPRVSAAIAAVRDGVAEHYRALAKALPGAAAKSCWQESHGALCMVGHAALIRLSEEIGSLLAHADHPTADAERIATVVKDAGAAILAHMDDLAASLPDRPMRLLAAYQAVLQARGIEHMPEGDVFRSGNHDLSSGSVAAVPNRIATELKNLNEAWCGWVEGRSHADALRAQIDEGERLASMFVSEAAAALLADIRTAMRAQLAAGKSDPDVAVEICSALLMLENLAEVAPDAARNFEPQVTNARARLQACQSDRSTLQRLPPIELVDARCRVDDAKAVVLAQADTAIGQVESALKESFADGGTRGALSFLNKPLAQCVGMFAMLQDPAAAATISLCREDIRQLAIGTNEDDAIRERLAKRLTALAEYVAASRHGPANLDELLVRAGLEKAAAAPNPRAEGATPPQTTGSELPDAEAVDSDVLEVFLEEAVEVLGAVENALPAHRGDPGNAEHLASLRRAFHTLKGSGRMVGLTELGEAAWEIEQVFNKLAEEKLAAPPDLCRLVEAAHQSFTRWIRELRAHGQAAIDRDTLTEWARLVRAGRPLPTPNDTATQTATVEAEAPAVKIGETTISPVLYGIFVEEARQHIATLRAHGERIVAEPALATEPEFLRAAHTLAATSATVGLGKMSELASSLERALLRAGKSVVPLKPSECSNVAQAVGRLADMVAHVAEREPTGAARPLIQALDNTALVPPAPRTSSTASAPPPFAPQDLSEASTAKPAERRVVRLDDDIDRELLSVFLTDAEELLPQIAHSLRDWRERSDDKLVPQSLQRLLHTIKGNARMAGAMAVGELTHQMETRIENASRLGTIPQSLHDELHASSDRLNELIDDLHRLQTESGSVSQALTTTLTGDFQPLTPTTITQPAVTTAPTQPSAPGLSTSGAGTAVTEPSAPTRTGKTAAAPRAILRVRAESAERLANQAGEVAIARARAQSELRSARAVMRELTDNIMRLRAQLREIEMQAEMQMQSRIAQTEESDSRFDPLEFDRFTRLQELTRLMAESVNDVATVQQNLVRNLEEGEAALGAQARTTRELQDDLVRIRMSPFSSLNERLYRVARLACRDVGKRVQLDIRGADAELDRGVLDRIVAPLEHLLRNAIAHGIEPEDVRNAAGKPDTGEIVIEVRQEGNEVVIGLSDDGAGLDLARIRERAIAKGLMLEDEKLSDAQIADFVFRSGFTTVENVSEIAGRGIGMDVVRNEISNLGGRIEMHFERGKGTRFTIYLSLALAVMKAVVIRAGEELYTVPSLLVEQVQSLKREALASAYSGREIVWRDTHYPLHYLAHLLGRTQAAPAPQRYNTVLLLRSGPHRAAIHVDQLLGGQEIVVKNVGPQLARVPGVTGAAVLADGETVLILNPVPLVQRTAQAGEQNAPAPVPIPAPVAEAAPTVVASPSAPATARKAAAQATILVVDDSLTVRKITSRTLTREGYTVVVAKDGIDALEKMQARAPDVIVTDIEMPRMDGFDLTRNVRADTRLKDLPVIMITSRTADKHRQHAAELGVTVFLGKPYEERELLENIAGVMRAHA